MKEFNFYIQENIVKKISPDLELANSLLRDSKERFDKAIKLDINEFNQFVFENIYDALRDILDSILAVYGFKSYSPEASISFLQRFKVSESIILELDNFRYKRNSSKYYGRKLSLDSSLEIISFYKKYSSQLIKLCKKKDNCAKK